MVTAVVLVGGGSLGVVERIPLDYEIRATGAPSSLKRAIRERAAEARLTSTGLGETACAPAASTQYPRCEGTAPMPPPGAGALHLGTLCTHSVRGGIERVPDGNTPDADAASGERRPGGEIFSE